MISSEVQRTLVKSPPELWAEISDPEALARHLGEFGEIRIKRVQPEQKVEWEAAEASGSIVIKPSGWGTKVKLTVTRELSEADAGDGAEQTPQAGELRAPDDGPTADEAQATDEEAPGAEAHEPQGTADGVRAAEPGATEQPIPTLATENEVDEDELGDAGDGLPDQLESSLGKPAEEGGSEPEPERRRGFFARLFGRRRVAHAADADGVDTQAVTIAPLDGLEQARDSELRHDDCDKPDVGGSEIADEGTSSAALAPERGVAIEAELDAEPATMPAASGASHSMDSSQADGASEHPSPAETAASLAAELEQAEEAAAEQVTAVLTGVLDRLGAAHHRPFSRA
ncbi:MAG: hypothetical protein ACHQHO_12775 [Solirubrobacterales bacterium]